MASDGTAITGLWFEGQRYFAATLAAAAEERALPIFDQTSRWLDVYFSGVAPVSCLPLELLGTPFQRAVWQALTEIPFGQMRTYAEVAGLAFGRSDVCVRLARAVGGAVARNPVSIVVPCHRVVGASGRLTGYAGGLWRKVRLLGTYEGHRLEKVGEDYKLTT